MTPDLKLIEDVAKEARAQALYRNEIEELGYDDDLLGMCAVASAILFQMLVDAGFDAKICYAVGQAFMDEAHVFCMVDDLIIDITASQFGLRDVEVLKKGSPHSRRWFWTPQRKFSTVEQLAVRQRKDQWPRHQRVDGILDLG